MRPARMREKIRGPFEHDLAQPTAQWSETFRLFALSQKILEKAPSGDAHELPYRLVLYANFKRSRES